MLLEIDSAIPLDPERKESVYRFVSRNRFLDHNLQFRFSGDAGGQIRTAVRVHLTEGPKKPEEYNAPYPWKGQGFPVDPFLTIEDSEGNLFGLQHCVEAVGFKHTYGALVHQEDINETWLFVAQDGAVPGTLMTAASIRNHSFKPIRIYGQSEGALEFMSPLREIEAPIDGEFYYSDEEKPVLIASPWSSEIGTGDYNCDEMRAEHTDLLVALREAVVEAAKAHQAPVMEF